jgi:aspartate carbamoyltransferase catalytic subunit
MASALYAASSNTIFLATDTIPAKTKSDALIMHPGPINCGVEIDSEIADCDRSLILEQVTNGLAVRMAVLFLLNGGKGPQEISEN